jgi:hypothetical protein
LRFLIEKLSKSMREKSGWDFLEFGSREQGSQGELGAPRSSWSQIELEILRNIKKNQEILKNIKKIEKGLTIKKIVIFRTEIRAPTKYVYIKTWPLLLWSTSGSATIASATPAAESLAKTSLDLGSQEKGPTLPNDKKLRFVIEKLSKSMREKSGWDFLEFGSRGQGSQESWELPGRGGIQ